ncbi:hypothetical protein [Mycobacterium sp. SMC-4]|uniref:hypothetical protein n=1 Tax=Mycobacterium sp. SMC-4 TaxID=2857059 RepID=UPI0021B46318|nr:hypothetical protein [Mycobacterium sp. SMC-4]
MTETHTRSGGGRLRMPRSRGAASGLLLILLGAWGALIPFIGPMFDFAFSPDRSWTWTAGRGWLLVLPGVVAVLGGVLLLMSRNRATAMLGAWLAVAAGAWFIIGRTLAGPLGLGDAGVPVAATEAQRVALELTYFYGLGALIVFLGAAAIGRISVRSVRDVEWAERPVVAPAAAPASAGPVATQPTPDDSRPVVDESARTEPKADASDGETEHADTSRRRGLRGMFRRGDRGSHHLTHR